MEEIIGYTTRLMTETSYNKIGRRFTKHIQMIYGQLTILCNCAVSWNGKHNERSELLKVQSFDFLESNTLIQEIEADYEFIRNRCATQGFSALTGEDGKWIQARTKGAGHGSTSRAFYARKSLIKEIIKL